MSFSALKKDDIKSYSVNALDGGLDGLIFYRRIVKEFAPYLKENGFFLFEIGYDQGDSLISIANENGFDCVIERDLSGNERNAILTRRVTSD